MSPAHDGYVIFEYDQTGKLTGAHFTGHQTDLYDFDYTPGTVQNNNGIWCQTGFPDSSGSTAGSSFPGHVFKNSLYIDAEIDPPTP